ncbi:uncharacterized protein LOC142165402 [Nicotiana tabacum]|uniref:Uncharacterized protein LOC142165402 n=1 Tax=Nicotiana tabacum TaxID=4097 RepID=A0AC58S516_TOBAC
MGQYLNKVQALLARFGEWSIIHIPREKNVEADALANFGSCTEMKGSLVLSFNFYIQCWMWTSELTNKVIIQNLKKKLEDAKGKWINELPGVLWAYWTTKKSSMGETPFSLVYGVEALILVEVGELTLRFFRTNEKAKNEALPVSLHLLHEHRVLVYVSMVAQKQRMERYYNHKANVFRYFKVGDLV